MISENANGHFKNGEKRSFPGRPARDGKPEKKPVDVIIPPGLAERFNVVEKEFDDNLPVVSTKEGDYQMLWLNNIDLERHHHAVDG